MQQPNAAVLARSSVFLLYGRRSTGGLGQAKLMRIVANELVTKPLAVGLDQSGGWMWEMDRQDESIGSGNFAQESPARLRRLHTVPVEDRRPVRLAALQGMMHQVSNDNGALPARADIDAAMTWRMARRWHEPQRVVELIIVIHQ